MGGGEDFFRKKVFPPHTSLSEKTKYGALFLHEQKDAHAPSPRS